MSHGGNKGKGAGTIDKLRNDVLKQAEASLSALVGKVSFSSTFSAATALQIPSASVAAATVVDSGSSPKQAWAPKVDRAEKDAVALLFDVDKLQCSVMHANDMTSRYGVVVLSINIISAKPADKTLMTALAKGAVAAAEAQQLETIAGGRAKAATIDARGCADALKISAQAAAEAEVTRAEGSRQAGCLLNEQPVAVQLAMIAANGDALKGAKSNLILGKDASGIGSMLMSNPDFTHGTMGMGSKH